MQASASVGSLMSPEKKKDIDRNYSDETFYTDSSEDLRSKCKSAATLLQKRRQLRPINGSGNPYRSTTRLTTLASPSKNNISMMSQKIMSAKLLRVKQLQNELTDAHFQLNDKPVRLPYTSASAKICASHKTKQAAINKLELSTENRILRTLQKRQDTALKKYEGTQAELPQLIRSHNEEVRALKSKLKQIKCQSRELENRLKIREGELSALREQHKHLLKLSKDKHLGEREHLQQQLEQMQELMKEQDKKVQMLTRKAMLEEKNYKHQLTTEVARHKKTTKELDIALERVAQLESVLETKEKYIAINMGRAHNFQTASVVSFGSQNRFRLFSQQVENTILPSTVTENNDHIRAELEEHSNTEINSDGPSDSQKDNIYQRMQIKPARRCLQRQRVELGVEEEAEEEEEEEDGFEQTMLSESLGSNTCPSQISTTESVENLSKDTTDICRDDDRKSEVNPIMHKNSVKYSEYGLETEDMHTSLKSKRQSLRRYSISGDSDFITEEHNPLNMRRGSLNGAGDSRKKEIHLVPNTFESEKRNFIPKSSPYIQKTSNEMESYVSSTTRSTHESMSPVASGDASERKTAGSAGVALSDMTVEEGRLHLKSINRTWNEIQNRIKDETMRAQSMIEKYDEERDDIDKYMSSQARRAETYDKNNLLAALKAIDEGNDLDFSDAVERRNSLLQCKSKKVEYRTSSNVVENLHRGIPSRPSVSAPMIDKPRKEHNIFWGGDTNEPSNILNQDISKTKENLSQVLLENHK